MDKLDEVRSGNVSDLIENKQPNASDRQYPPAKNLAYLRCHGHKAHADELNVGGSHRGKEDEWDGDNVLFQGCQQQSGILAVLWVAVLHR